MEELIITNEKTGLRIHNLSQKEFQQHNTFPNGIVQGCRYELTVRQISTMLIQWFGVDTAEANRTTNEISNIAKTCGKTCRSKFIVDVCAENDPAYMDIHMN